MAHDYTFNEMKWVRKNKTLGNKNNLSDLLGRMVLIKFLPKQYITKI